LSLASRRVADDLTGVVPFLMALGGWALLSNYGGLPEYMLPPLSQMGVRFRDALADGSLLRHVSGSLYRLAISFVLGNAIAIPLGIAIAMNRHVSDLLRPVLTFFQSIAGIAWVPLAVIWFGIGMGSVIFVITNTIFFGAIYSTVIGVQTIPKTLHRAVLCHGAKGVQVFTELILPGALVQIILGLRTSMAYGWRALVAGEMIAGSSGLGYMTIEAVQWYQTDTVILGMILIGLLWLMLDRLLFAPLERRTVARWGLLQR
jgi:NitT/TauT family transport system permease protein/taurine transport system permease protein